MKSTPHISLPQPSPTTIGGISRSGPVSVPVSTAAAMEQAIREASRARAHVIETMTTAEIIEILAAAANAWRQPHYGPRARLLSLLARDLRMPLALLDKGLEAIFGAVSERELRRMVENESENPLALDEPVECGRVARLLGPRIVFHSLAGNVPGLSIPPIVSALLARSICIVRDSDRQPHLTAAFLSTLADFSRDLAAMVIPASWRAGDMGMEKLIFEQAQRVELTGSDSTIASMVSRHPRRPIVTRGSRVSVGVVPRQSDTDQWKDGFATDIVMYEGMGCLTPHVIFVEGDEKRGKRLARLLGIALSRYEALYPRIPREMALEARRRSFLDAAEMMAARDRDDILQRGRGDAFVVHYHRDAPVVIGPGLRCIVVATVEDRADLYDRLRRSHAPLAAVGLGLETDHPAYPDLAHSLESLGATLICAPGQMQAPPIAWAQDGHRRLADLLEWRTVEDGLGS
ncbi:MAG TPA: acyl-CoA reductase [Candidatus Limnocylindrales bacterium]|nr:acyl-CoA reductase [Candidatus Limnocylindrales bacterium]